MLFIHAPTAIVPSSEVAQRGRAACSPGTRGRNVLGCWLGGDSLAAARGTVSERASRPMTRRRSGAGLHADRAVPAQPETADAGAGLAPVDFGPGPRARAGGGRGALADGGSMLSRAGVAAAAGRLRHTGGGLPRPRLRRGSGGGGQRDRLPGRAQDPVAAHQPQVRCRRRRAGPGRRGEPCGGGQRHAARACARCCPTRVLAASRCRQWRAGPARTN